MTDSALDEDRTASDFDDDFEPFDIEGAPELPAERYLDRELSWLAFNQRVLELAEDPRLPVLERANFLAIFASNLDEFFMVRVAGLKRRIITGLAVPTNVGRAPHRRAERRLAQGPRAAGAARGGLPGAREAGARRGGHPRRVVGGARRARARAPAHVLLGAQIFPVLMPLAVDPAHPFPYISGLSLNLSVRVRNSRTGRQEFARVKVPQMLPRFVRVDPDESIEDARYVTLEELIANHLGDLFPGMEIVEHHVFRVTRNEDVEIEEDETENLIKALEKELLRRRFGPPIRLEITDDMDDVTLGLLVRELDVTEQEVFRLPAPLDLGGLFDLARLDRPELHYPTHVPTTALQLQPSESNLSADVFAAISRKDVLVHHPYESFATSVQAFLEQAAADPDVLAIKQTLYRTSGDSPIVEALIDAAESGKQVLALVEIKARFDEQANISWARKLEKAGVHVVYGLVGLKTHCKLALVIRQEKGGLRHYSHIGTGNYNPKTSRIYEDLGLLTADDQVGKDLTRLFNELSGYAIEKKFKRLLVAPLHLRKGLLKLIAGEVRNAEARPARGHPHQGELDRRRGHHRRPVPRLERGRARRGVGARHLQPASGHPRPQREHPGALDPRPLPRALAHLLLRERRRPADLHRVRRHDAPQPRSPHRGARAPHRPRPHRRDRLPVRHGHGRAHELVVARRRAASGPATRSTTRDIRSTDMQIATHAADRTAHPPGEAALTTAVYAAGAVCWRIIDGRCTCWWCTARCTATSRSRRARSIRASRSPAPPCARSPRRPASRSRSGCRSASRGTRCRAGARRSCTTGRPR